MPDYKTRAPIPLKDGTTIPTGAMLTVAWSRDAYTHITVWHRPASDGGPRTLKLGGRNLGAAIAGDLPNDAQLREWTFDSVCETPSGDTVEPDGHGPNGEPSWLLILGLL